jgi:hypothetical protein
VGLRGHPLSRFVVVAQEFDWEAEGQRLGETLGAFHCLVVLGDVPDDAALAALGIARVQARHRRVVVIDLLGESPPLQHLLGRDDAHGIVDCFLYGVSLNRVAVPVEQGGNLSIVPTGSEPPQYEQILAHPRWDRLIANARDTGSLLVIVVPSGAREIETLAAKGDGAIVVGDAVPPQLPFSRIVASVRRSVVAVPDAESSASGFDATLGTGSRRVAAIVGSVLAIIILASMTFWLAMRPYAHVARPADRLSDTSVAGREAVRRSIDSSTPPDSLTTATLAASMPVPINPADSTDAAGFAVVLESNSTRAGAILRQQRNARAMPAATFVPILVRGAQWYQSRVGAFARAAQADSLLQLLRDTGQLADSSSGRVVRAPLAFLLDSAVSPATASTLLAEYALREQPAYGLRQRDGTVHIYLGAFESPEESIPLAELLRASRDSVPPLVYRTGRVF